MTIKIKVRKIIAELSSRVGITNVIEGLPKFNNAFVLMYHRILNKNFKLDYKIISGMSVMQDTFADHLFFLKKRYDVVFLEDIVARVLSGKRSADCCAITFDDGWRDNFTNAFPVLLENKVPANVFLATGFIGTSKMFWHDELSLLIERIPLKELLSLEYPAFFKNLIEKHRIIISEDRMNFINLAIDASKKALDQERKELLRKLNTKVTFHPIERQLMNWDEVKTMHDSGLVKFGAHTTNHVLLDQVPINRAEFEIQSSRLEIASRLGVPCATFAYPNGNFDGSLEKIIARNDFVGAVTTQKGCITKKTAMTRIPRIAVHQDISATPAMLQALILLGKVGL